MNNQKTTYGQSNYRPERPNVWVVSSNGEQKITFESKRDYSPSLLLLTSIIKAREDRDSGKASPVFSSVKEMKKWFEEQK
jgi:hypothetical protein